MPDDLKKYDRFSASIDTRIFIVHRLDLQRVPLVGVQLEGEGNASAFEELIAFFLLVQGHRAGVAAYIEQTRLVLKGNARAGLTTRA